MSCIPMPVLHVCDNEGNAGISEWGEGGGGGIRNTHYFGRVKSSPDWSSQKTLPTSDCAKELPKCLSVRSATIVFA